MLPDSPAARALGQRASANGIFSSCDLANQYLGAAARRMGLLLCALMLGSAAAVGTLILRWAATGVAGYTFLLWNLFLAWIPLGLALLACRRTLFLPLRLALGLAWLLFLPNAFYLVTDMVHLRERPPVPLWLDLLVVQLFVWQGLLLGFVSLYWVQQRIERHWGALSGWLFAASVLCLSGLGVYFGRVLRWNSWDLLLDPRGFLPELLAFLRHPIASRTAVVFPVAVACFYCLAYLMLYALSGLRRSRAVD